MEQEKRLISDELTSALQDNQVLEKKFMLMDNQQLKTVDLPELSQTSQKQVSLNTDPTYKPRNSKITTGGLKGQPKF